MRRELSKPLLWLLLVLLAMTAISGPIGCSAVEVHDDIATVTPPGPEVKCGCSTCGNPCYVQPPPSPPPPPESPSPPFCPPPPPSYILGPPGSLYPLDPGYYPSGAPGRSLVVHLPVLLRFGGLLGLWGFWWL